MYQTLCLDLIRFNYVYQKWFGFLTFVFLLLKSATWTGAGPARTGAGLDWTGAGLYTVAWTGAGLL